MGTTFAGTEKWVGIPEIGDTASASVGRELSQTGAMITQRNLNVQRMINVPAGYKFTVRVNRDILFDGPMNLYVIYQLSPSQRFRTTMTRQHDLATDGPPRDGIGKGYDAPHPALAENAKMPDPGRRTQRSTEFRPAERSDRAAEFGDGA